MQKQSKEDKKKKVMGLLALSRVEDISAGSCPEPEELALLIEGKLGDTEKDALHKHLSSCRSCYDTWLSAAVDHDSENARRRTNKKRSRIYKSVGSALAVAASVMLYLNVIDQSPQTVIMQDKDDNILELPQVQSLPAKPHSPEPSQVASGTADFVLEQEAPLMEERKAKRLQKVEDAGSVKGKISSTTVNRTESSSTVEEYAEEAPLEQHFAAPGPVEDTSAMKETLVPPAITGNGGEMQKFEQKSVVSGNIGIAPSQDTTADLQKMFFQDVVNLCEEPEKYKKDWVEMIRRGEKYQHIVQNSVQYEKFQRILAILRDIVETGDDVAGCDQLQGELAEEGESR